MTPLQTEAIAHYDRMIEWAKGQDKNDCPDYEKMYDGINEAWSGIDCPYCNMCAGCVDMHDRLCPLKKGVKSCCNGLWGILSNADTWREWIIAAEAVKQYIIENGA